MATRYFFQCFFLCILALLMVAACGKEAPAPFGALSEAWTLDGFAGPESVILEPEEGVFYVSNVDGAPTEKDGKGAISKVSLGGEMIERDWVLGLHGPKGLAIDNGTLYVSDVDRLAAIDLTSRAVRFFEASGAKFLNDVTVDNQGRVYVSDMMTDSIWRLDGDDFSLWLQSPDLAFPNGLHFEEGPDGGRLVLGSWGVITDGFATDIPGHVSVISIDDKTITPLGSGTPVGNLDGVEADGTGSYLLTDWMSGALLRFVPNAPSGDGGGEVTTLIDLNQGSADHEYVASHRLVVIPMMMDGQLKAWRVE